jgi:phospholipid transport system substrate-binding protein
VESVGGATIIGIRDDQIKPIMKEGGWPNLLKLMKDKDAELKTTLK